jgi:hypothetical protein
METKGFTNWKTGMLYFYTEAKSLGFTVKVTGDYAFRNVRGDIIRLKSLNPYKWVIAKR